MDNRFKVFVKEDVEYYEKVWKMKYSWNWAAFFLSILWMGYRKMYREILVVLLIHSVLGIIFVNLELNLFESLYFAIGLVTSIFLGIYGNTLYKRKSEKVIIHVSRLKLSEQEELREIEQRGGTSILGIFVSLIMYFIIYFAQGVILSILLNY